MTLSLDILAARMRQGESIPLGDTARGVRHKAFLDAAFNKIASNIRMVKIYSVENDGILYAFFEVQVLSTPEDFAQRLSPYANECVRAIREVAAFVNSHPSLAES